MRRDPMPGAGSTTRDVQAAEVIVVDTYEDARHVLRHPSYVQILPTSGHGAEHTAALAHGSVLHLDGDDHFERRRLLSTLFRRDLLLAYEQQTLLPALARILGELVAGPGGAGGTKGDVVTVDLLTLCREVFVDLFSRLVGFEGLEDRAGRSAFLEDFAIYERGFRAKFVEDPEEAVAAALDARDRILGRHFVAAWERRARALEGAVPADAEGAALPKDLMTLLLQHREHYRRWGDDAQWREAMLFMVASIGSTSNAICHAVGDLLTWLAAGPERRANLADPGFLEAAFRDSVRLHQTNRLLRTAVAEDALPSGQHVPAGVVVAVDREAVNLDIEARSSRPEVRFAPDRSCPQGVRGQGLSFGEGPHTCIGRTMVLGEQVVRAGGSDGGELEGLAVTTLRYLFDAQVSLVPEDPPALVEGMARETWERFPVRLRPA